MAKYDARLERISKGNGLLYAPGAIALKVQNNNAMKYGRMLRDQWLFQFPILPGAVTTYAQIVVSREWTVTGSPRRAAKAVEELNNTQFMDDLGTIHYGWHAFETRRVYDWLCLGQTAMLMPRGARGNLRGILQYVDPTEVDEIVQSVSPRDRIIRTNVSYEKQKRWRYLDQDWRRDEVIKTYSAPIGGSGYSPAPLLSILPTARLAYLIREHDLAATDGRKIRDIMIVANDALRDAFATAVAQAVELWNGGSAAEHGIPVVSAAANVLGESAIDVSKLFGRLGLADVPEHLNRSEFWLDYAQEVSAVLDLALRSFWNDPRGSNRSLEKVTQERARRQGPAFFVLAEERAINNNGILGDRVRFGFVEEADLAMLKDRAVVAQTYADAIQKLKVSIPEISGRALMSWLQQLDVLPRDEDLVNEIQRISESPVQAEDMIDGDIQELIEEQAEENLEAEIDVTQQRAEAMQPQIQNTGSNQRPTNEKTLALFREAKALESYLRSDRSRALTPDYGEIVMDSNGNIVEHRARTFHISGYMKELAAMKALDEEVMSEEDWVIEVDRVVENAFTRES